MKNDKITEAQYWDNFYTGIDFCLERRPHCSVNCWFSQGGIYRWDILPVLYFSFPFRFDIQQCQDYISIALQKNIANTFLCIVADFLLSTVILFIIRMDIYWIQIF